MPRYTVYIEEDPGSGTIPYEYGAYDDPLEAEFHRYAAELSYPNGAVWVEDGKKNIPPREGFVPPSLPYTDVEDEEGCCPDND